MGRKRIAKAERFREHIAEQARLGLSDRVYAERIGVSRSQLCYWRRVLQERPAPAAFVRVEPRAAADSAAALGSVKVVLPSGLQLEIPATTDAPRLAALVRELGRQL